MFLVNADIKRKCDLRSAEVVDRKKKIFLWR